MTNLERYKDEFVYMLNEDNYQPPLCNYFEKIWTYPDCSCCPFCTKDETICDYQKFVDWLLAEHKEPIKLKRWEYDLIRTNDMSHSRKFNSFNTYKSMKRCGYFNGITNTSMTLKEILENCEVVDD